MSGLEQVDLERFKETPVDADRGVRHPLIRSGAIEKRDYQLDIARTTIVFPNPVGKTTSVRFTIAVRAMSSW
jgi:ERCC4-related helicase